MKKILVVDDDAAIRDTLFGILKESGYKVSCARNGKEALKKIAEEVPDLVVIDIIMPEKEGIETIFELRKKYVGIKIIAMSGGGMISAKGYLEIAEKVGVKYTLTKPFETEKFLETVGKALEEE
jgi:CheY-like chemotaxis protein